MEAIQIAHFQDSGVKVELGKLKNCLESIDKNRHLVLVSIAGAFRTGKSFLLNIFLKYLKAKYVEHDASNWLGDHDEELCGFKWEGDKKPVTSGIWIWPEMFTYDYENGEKVAIILMDTQGIFDHQNIMKDSVTVFSLSMLLSSVQLYNLMNNINMSDIDHLALFTDYGQLLMDQSNEKSFQKLWFIVRDWQLNNKHGFSGQELVDDVLSDNTDLKPEIVKRNKCIKMTFQEKFVAFTLPHPGVKVSQTDFKGKLSDIDQNFLKYVSELVPAIFAPENLIVKQINGQKIRVGDLTQYIETYAESFNGNDFPEPISLLEATAMASNAILSRDCLNSYLESIREQVKLTDDYLPKTKMNQLNEAAKNRSLSEFKAKPKLGGNEMASRFLEQLENDIQKEFRNIIRDNEWKRIEYVCKMFEKRMYNEIYNHRLSDNVFNNLFKKNEKRALNEFDSERMDNEDDHYDLRRKLRRKLYILKDEMKRVNKKMEEVQFRWVPSWLMVTPGLIFGAVVGALITPKIVAVAAGALIGSVVVPLVSKGLKAIITWLNPRNTYEKMYKSD